MGRPDKKMLIVPFVNPFSQKEESIERGEERERERAQLAAAAGGEGEVRKEGGQAKWSLPHGHIAFRVEKEKRGGGLEEMDSLKEEGKAFPSYFFLFASKASEGVALTPDLGCANDGPSFRATLLRRDQDPRQFPSSSSLALPWG